MNVTLEVYRIDRSQKLLATKPPFEKFAKEIFLEQEGIRLLRCHSKNKLMKKYKVLKQVGIPDFCYESDSKIVFVEVKSGSDGLRYMQLDWLLRNQQYLTRIVYVEVILLRRTSFGREVYIDSISSRSGWDGRAFEGMKTMKMREI